MSSGTRLPGGGLRQGTRQTSASVEFRYPFRLGTDERELPAGIYRIETLEEEHISHLGSVFVTVGIDFVVRKRGRTSTWMVRPSDLHDALARDLEHDAFSDKSRDAPRQPAHSKQYRDVDRAWSVQANFREDSMTRSASSDHDKNNDHVRAEQVSEDDPKKTEKLTKAGRQDLDPSDSTE